MSKQPQQLAFVVATKDRREDLRRMLQSLSEQSFHPAQIVIVDASSIPVQGITAEFNALNIKYIRHLQPSASKQRNVGIRAADPNIDTAGFKCLNVSNPSTNSDIILNTDQVSETASFLIKSFMWYNFLYIFLIL